MTNGETFFYVALGIIFAVGAYTFYLAVMLDRALKLIEKQKQEIARLVLPPFQVVEFLPKKIFAAYNVSGSWYTYFINPRRKATMLLSSDNYEPNDYDGDQDLTEYEDDWSTVEYGLFGDC